MMGVAKTEREFLLSMTLRNGLPQTVLSAQKPTDLQLKHWKEK
jgi:hypothetical protein